MNHFSRIASALEAQNLDAVLLTCPENRFYASGYRTPSDDGVALVTRDASYFWIDMRYFEDAAQVVSGATVALCARGISYHQLVRAQLSRHAVRRLGFDDASMSVRAHALYAQKLPCELIGASDFLTDLRAQKDAQELARMVSAQRIAERALTELLNDLKVGVSERSLAARLTFLMLQYGAQDTSFDPIVISGAKTSVPHGVPSDKTLAAGDFVTMDFGALYEGYCSDMTRTVAVGHVTQEMATVYETVLRAQTAGIAAARAGVAGQTIDAAARSVIEAAGYGAYFGHSFGHGLGIEIHEPPGASPANAAPLPAGAVISAEPGIYLPGRFGVRIEDVLVLQEGGSENLTRAPKALLIV